MAKSPDAFRTISEVADWLDTPAHVLRFWESKFTQVKPVKRAGGRRYYRPDDMSLLGGIKTLLHDEGMTIKGVQKLLREKGVRHVMALGPELRPDDVAAEPVRMPPPKRAPVRASVEDAEIVSEAAARDLFEDSDAEGEVVPEAPFAEAEEPAPTGTLVPFPGTETAPDEDDEDDLAIGPGFARAFGGGEDAAEAERDLPAAADGESRAAPDDPAPSGLDATQDVPRETGEHRSAEGAGEPPDLSDEPFGTAGADDLGPEVVASEPAGVTLTDAPAHAGTGQSGEGDRAEQSAIETNARPDLPADPPVVAPSDIATGREAAGETAPAAVAPRKTPGAKAMPPTATTGQPPPGLLGLISRADRQELGRRRSRLAGPTGRLAAVAERLANERS